jgi:hypothetical protein
LPVLSPSCHRRSAVLLVQRILCPVTNYAQTGCCAVGHDWHQARAASLAGTKLASAVGLFSLCISPTALTPWAVV